MQVGVIGAGGMGNVHTRHWARMEEVELFAYDHDSEKNAEFCGRYGASAVGSYEELLDRVEVVDICLPTPLHHSATLQAIDAGKAVLVEKPMARTIEECREMIGAAERTRAFLSVAQVVRYFPEHKRAHELVMDGAVGTPAAVRMRRGGGAPTGSGGWFQDFEKSGGVLLDLAVHEFDWLCWTLGPATQVFSRSVRFGEKQVEADYVGDYALTTVSFENGAVAHVEATWLDPGGFRTTLEVAGSGGIIEFDSRLYPAVRVNTADGSSAMSQMDSADDPYFLQLSAFVNAYRKGNAPPVPGREGLQAVGIALAALESAKTGRPVVPERF